MLLSLLAAAAVTGAGARLVRVLERPIPEPDDAPPASPATGAAGTPADPPADPAPADDPDARIRRGATLSGSALAMAVGGHVVPPLAPLLTPAAAGLLVWNVLPHLGHAWRDLRDDRRLGRPLLEATSIVGVLAGGYWVVAGVHQLMIQGASWLNRRTERQSRADLEVLFDQQVPTARLWRATGEVEVPTAALAPGDVVLVDAGMIIPVDGAVLDGLGRADEQTLTGEARPVEKGPGAPVLAGTLLLEGRLRITVQRSGAETRTAALLALLAELEQARDLGRSRAERTVERWVPATLVASAVAAPLLGPSSALAMMYTGVGYGLLYGGPLATLRAMRRAGDGGVLVRDGRALERLAEVDVVVFDKTGTLTHEIPRVARVVALGPIDGREVLRLATTAERHQSHPIAKAVRRAADLAGIDPLALEAAEVRPGLGLAVTIDGHDVLVGSPRLLTGAGIESVVELDGALTDGGSDERMRVFVAVDGALAGVIELEAALRTEAPAVISALRDRGIEVVVLSGDRHEATRRVAARLGVDEAFGEVMPEGKAERVRALRTAGRRVCFVGDGINDTLALQEADVSISLSGAAPIAETAASIVLTTGALSALPALFSLADGLARNLGRSETLSKSVGALCFGGVLGLGVGVGQAMLLYNTGLTGILINALSPLPEAGVAAQGEAEAIESVRFERLALRRPLALERVSTPAVAAIAPVGAHRHQA